MLESFNLCPTGRRQLTQSDSVAIGADEERVGRHDPRTQGVFTASRETPDQSWCREDSDGALLSGVVIWLNLVLMLDEVL